MSKQPEFPRKDSGEEDPGPEPGPDSVPKECLQEPEVLVPSERGKDHHKKQKKKKDSDFKSKFLQVKIVPNRF
jgi:hypothetical protein